MNTNITNGAPTLTNPSTPETIDAGVKLPVTGGDDLKKAYDNTAAERAAIGADELLPLNLDVDTVVTTVLATSGKLTTIHGSIVEIVPGDIVAKFARLLEYGQALAKAQALFNTAMKPAPELPAFHDRAAKIRLLLASDAAVLTQRGLVAQSIIDGLKGAVGYVNTASDLQTLITLYQTSWSKISEMTAIKTADLQEAEQAYTALMSAIVARGQAGSLESATDQRLRAYTLVLRAYDEARRVVSFVRWHEADLEDFVPSLWTGRGTRTKKDQPTPAPTPTPVPPPVAAAPATPAIHAPVAPNMPGGSPFAS